MFFRKKIQIRVRSNSSFVLAKIMESTVHKVRFYGRIKPLVINGSPSTRFLAFHKIYYTNGSGSSVKQNLAWDAFKTELKKNFSLNYRNSL